MKTKEKKEWTKREVMCAEDTAVCLSTLLNDKLAQHIIAYNSHLTFFSQCYWLTGVQVYGLSVNLAWMYDETAVRLGR